MNEGCKHLIQREYRDSYSMELGYWCEKKNNWTSEMYCMNCKAGENK